MSNQRVPRNFVAQLYALAILQQMYCRPPMFEHDWHAVNSRIAERWSWSAVTWIKKRAWEIADQLAKEHAGDTRWIKL